MAPSILRARYQVLISSLIRKVKHMTDKTMKLLELALEMELSRKAEERKKSSERTLEDIYEVLVRDVERAA